MLGATKGKTPNVDIAEELQKLREVLQVLVSSREQNRNISFSQEKKPKRKRGRPKGDLKMNFCLYMPQKLYLKLKNYLETYGDKGETMASIIIAGTEKELKERIARKLSRTVFSENYEKRE